jgi:4-hydroxy-tetrahydrodipicolinate synthase
LLIANSSQSSISNRQSAITNAILFPMTGVIAAVATPVGADGGPGRGDVRAAGRVLIESGVDGQCPGGATSEYPNTALEDRKAAIGAAARHLPLDRKLLVAIGASSLRQSLELGESARAAGSRAVLLPMPMFFRYAQHDLEAFSIEVSRTLRVPVLLYDLPDFTNPLAPATVIRLLQNEGLIVGIKDSSGIVENLVCYATARGNRGWTLLVGNDRLLLTGLKAGWDGTVSGIAGFCPALPLAIHRSWTRGDTNRAAHLQTLLDEAVLQLDTPTPGDSHRARGARIRHGAAPAASQSSSARTARAISHMAAGLDGSCRLRGQRLRRGRLQCAGSDGGSQQGTAT